MTEFNVKEVTVCRVAIYLFIFIFIILIVFEKVLRQIYFLGIYEVFNTNNSSKIWTTKCDVNKE